MENLFNNIFPPKCLFCGKIEAHLCKSCLTKCNTLLGGYCIVCDGKTRYGATHKKCYKKGVPVQVISCFQYEGLVRTCIKRSKYNSKLFSAMKNLVRHGLAIVSDEIFQIPKIREFIVIPVPSSQKKLTWRGFNQAEILADIFSKKFKVKKDRSILTRVSDTKAQYEIGREKRFENVKGVFRTSKLGAAKIKGRKVFLIDDICTTGATLLETSKVLYQAGASQVRCFTLSKKLKYTQNN